MSWHPTLQAMWSPVGQQVMIPTPARPIRHYGIGAVDYHTGQTVVLIQKHKCRQQIALLLESLLEQHHSQTVYVAWDNAHTHSGGEVEQVVRAAAGRLVLLYLPTYSPWLNPIERLWRQFRREVTHCEIFASLIDLLDATKAFFDRCNDMKNKILTIIGGHPAKIT